MPNMTRAKVTNPEAQVVLTGDHGWLNQWNPNRTTEVVSARRREWHGRSGHYNVAFLGGNVDFLDVKEGAYFVPGKYYVLPFKELNDLAPEFEPE